MKGFKDDNKYLELSWKPSGNNATFSIKLLDVFLVMQLSLPKPLNSESTVVY